MYITACDNTDYQHKIPSDIRIVGFRHAWFYLLVVEPK